VKWATATVTYGNLKPGVLHLAELPGERGHDVVQGDRQSGAVQSVQPVRDGNVDRLW
jgi:hypothetical protein